MHYPPGGQAGGFIFSDDGAILAVGPVLPYRMRFTEKQAAVNFIKKLPAPDHEDPDADSG
jgi:hypothetical protein